jgi:transposase
MIMNTAELPSDIDELKSLLLESEKERSLLLDELNKLKAELKYNLEKLNLLMNLHFGRKSEKKVEVPEGQLLLFDEAESISEEKALEKGKYSTIPEHKRKIAKKGRKPLPEELPRKKTIHDIAEEMKTCSCGCKMVSIGEEISEKLNIIPAQIFVEQHIYPKYICASCSKKKDEEKVEIKKAPAIPQIIPGSLVTPELLAYIPSRPIAATKKVYH